MMSAGDVVELLSSFEQEGVSVRIDGGWAVDALLGEQTRVHNDIDLIVEEPLLGKLHKLLETQGFSLQVDEDTTPWNYVLGNDKGQLIDLHVIT